MAPVAKVTGAIGGLGGGLSENLKLFPMCMLDGYKVASQSNYPNASSVCSMLDNVWLQLQSNVPRASSKVQSLKRLLVCLCSFFGFPQFCLLSFHIPLTNITVLASLEMNQTTPFLDTSSYFNAVCFKWQVAIFSEAVFNELMLPNFGVGASTIPPDPHQHSLFYSFVVEGTHGSSEPMCLLFLNYVGRVLCLSSSSFKVACMVGTP
eukprot:1140026-Pelagomonas_calceolata.AAC.13